MQPCAERRRAALSRSDSRAAQPRSVRKSALWLLVKIAWKQVPASAALIQLEERYLLQSSEVALVYLEVRFLLRSSGLALRNGSIQGWQLQEGTLPSSMEGLSHLFRGIYPIAKGFESHRAGQCLISARLECRAGRGCTEPESSQGETPGSVLPWLSASLLLACAGHVLPCPVGMIFPHPEPRWSGPGLTWAGCAASAPGTVRGAAPLPCTPGAGGAQSAFFSRAGCLHTQTHTHRASSLS